MSTTKLTFDEFMQLPPDEQSYELNEGELLVTPSPAPYHNIVRYRLRHALGDFVEPRNLGIVIDETDFRIGVNTIRRPDIAFLATSRLEGFDLDQSPIEGASTLAVEVISPGNTAVDMMQKVHHILTPGRRWPGWLILP